VKAVWRQQVLDKARDMQRYVLDLNEWRNSLKEDVAQIRATTIEATQGVAQSQQQQEANAQLSAQQSTVGFTIEAINNHIQRNHHPCSMLLQEFKNAFLFKNRHLLFIECKNPADTDKVSSSAEFLNKPEDGLVGKEVP